MFLGVLHRIAELENRLLTKDEQGSLEKAVLVHFKLNQYRKGASLFSRGCPEAYGG
jgi:hypothetical protein